MLLLLGKRRLICFPQVLVLLNIEVAESVGGFRSQLVVTVQCLFHRPFGFKLPFSPKVLPGLVPPCSHLAFDPKVLVDDCPPVLLAVCALGLLRQSFKPLLFSS